MTRAEILALGDALREGRVAGAPEDRSVGRYARTPNCDPCPNTPAPTLGCPGQCKPC